jgi:pilus assembly protein CpaB
MFRVFLLMIALAAGGAAAWLALVMRGEPAVATVVPTLPPPQTQDVLVAAADLGKGQTLTRENMRWQSWPASAVNPAYVNRSARADAIETLAGSIVRSAMIAGEPIRDEKLVPLNSGFLSAMLPSGKRAMAVRVSAENTAGGFILPNDRVDVLHTVTSEGQKERVSRTILRNVPVLAIDQSVDERSRDEKVKAKAVFVGKTATLEVAPWQAEILAAGEATGTLSLALRSAADHGEVLPPGREKSTATVRIFRSGQMEVVDVIREPMTEPPHLLASTR